MDSASKMSDAELTLAVASAAAALAEMTAELGRRASLPRHDESDPVDALIGPDEACVLLHMKRRRLYALEKAGGLPFARSRSQKDRAYNKAALLKWRDKPRAA
jgi:hypothetical protein